MLYYIMLYYIILLRAGVAGAVGPCPRPRRAPPLGPPAPRREPVHYIILYYIILYYIILYYVHSLLRAPPFGPPAPRRELVYYIILLLNCMVLYHVHSIWAAHPLSALRPSDVIPCIIQVYCYYIIIILLYYVSRRHIISLCDSLCNTHIISYR